MSKPKTATDRRKAFAAHCIASLDHVSAALPAGYSEAAVATQGARLLEDADVRALISEVESRENASDDVTRLLQAMLRFDLTEVVEIKSQQVFRKADQRTVGCGPRYLTYYSGTFAKPGHGVLCYLK